MKYDMTTLRMKINEACNLIGSLRKENKFLKQSIASMEGEIERYRNAYEEVNKKFSGIEQASIEKQLIKQKLQGLLERLEKFQV